MAIATTVATEMIATTVATETIVATETTVVHAAIDRNASRVLSVNLVKSAHHAKICHP
ncbi:MAG: hypothetical protein ACKPAJ_11995 [Actinomycetota bacterium]